MRAVKMSAVLLVELDGVDEEVFAVGKLGK